jgi:hypothetical protein
MATNSATPISNFSIKTQSKDANGTDGVHGFSSLSLSDTSSYQRTAKQRLNGSSHIKSRVSSINQAVRHNVFTGNDKIGFLQETVTALKKKSISELGAGVSQTLNDASFINLVEWIRSERLATLPHKGSTWDKVLIRALYFAEQLHGFEKAAQGVIFDHNAVAQIGYGHARLLLQVYHPLSV